MNAQDFVFAAAGILFIAFAAGWFGHWLVSRITRVTRSDMDELDKMAQALHEAEHTRDEAIAWAKKREGELSNQLHQTEAELRAAMDGLRDARHEAETLRARVAGEA